MTLLDCLSNSRPSVSSFHISQLWLSLSMLTTIHLPTMVGNVGFGLGLGIRNQTREEWMRASNVIFCKVQNTVICRGVQVNAFLLLTRPGLPQDQNTQKLLLTLTSKSKPDNSILESFITIYFIRTGSGKIRRIPMVNILF